MIGVHVREGSFSDKWLECLREGDIPHKVVDCFHPGFMAEISDCDVLLWHWSQIDPKAVKVARQITCALEESGVVVFPSARNSWHFDDKIGQAYLLAALAAPSVGNYVFFDRKQALDWIATTTFPKVFKLRTGAGGLNVRLVDNATDARKLCRRSFRLGFLSFSRHLSDGKNKLKRLGKSRGWLAKLKRINSFMRKTIYTNLNLPIERGYFYMQDFLPNNEYDQRITVIGKRAFGFIRHNRAGDFRASGSGSITFAPDEINIDCVRIAFEVAEKISAQSLAFDFINDELGNPKLVEISYCYASEVIHKCTGYWTPAMDFVPGHYWPEEIILKDLLKTVSLK